MAELTLQNVALLARIEIRTWTGEKRDAALSDEIAERHGTDRRTAGSFVKNLLGRSRKDLDNIRNLAQAARSDACRYSLPYHTDGYRIVPLQQLQTYMERMREHREKYASAVSDFLNRYDVMIQEARDSLNGMFNQDDYPTRGELNNRFEFDVHLEPVPDSNQFDGLLKLPDLEQRLRSDLDDKLSETAKSATDTVRQQLVTIATELRDRFRDYTGGRAGRFSQRWIDTQCDNVQTCESLNLFSDPAITSWASQIRQSVSDGAEALRNVDRLRSTAVSSLSRVLSEMGIETLPDTEPATTDDSGASEGVPSDSPAVEVEELKADMSPVDPPAEIDYDSALAELL